MTTGVLCSGRKRVYRSAAIHLWRFSLAHAENGISWARPLLSPEELERGARFCRPRDGSRFLLCRACAKTILAAHRPDVRLATSFLLLWSVGETVGATFSFSISRLGTGMEALLAVCEGCPIGCDIQWTGSAVDAHGIADFFHPRERLALDALPPDDYARGFYRMWVRKEAVMKACGKGLGTGLDRVLVSAESGGHHASIQEALPDEGEHWWAPCAIGRDGYAVALAIPENEAPRPIIRHRLRSPFAESPRERAARPGRERPPVERWLPRQDWTAIVNI